MAEQLLIELDRVLRYERTRRIHRMTDAEIDAVVLGLHCTATMVALDRSVAAIVANPTDNAVLERALRGEADLIVTGDKKHLLPLGSYAELFGDVYR